MAENGICEVTVAFDHIIIQVHLCANRGENCPRSIWDSDLKKGQDVQKDNLKTQQCKIYTSPSSI